MSKSGFFRTPLMFIGVVYIFLCFFASCDNSDEPSDSGKIEVVQDFRLINNFHIDAPDDKAFVFSSKSLLQEFFGKAASEFGEIDFRNYKLIYVQGVSPCAFHVLEYDLDTSSKSTTLTIDASVEGTALTVLQRWGLGLVVTKNCPDKIKVTVRY